MNPWVKVKQLTQRRTARKIQVAFIRKSFQNAEELHVSLQSAKPFSNYEGLKIHKGILKPVGKCCFQLFEPPSNAENDVTVDH